MRATAQERHGSLRFRGFQRPVSPLEPGPRPDRTDPGRRTGSTTGRRPRPRQQEMPAQPKGLAPPVPTTPRSAGRHTVRRSHYIQS